MKKYAMLLFVIAFLLVSACAAETPGANVESNAAPQTAAPATAAIETQPAAAAASAPEEPADAPAAAEETTTAAPAPLADDFEEAAKSVSDADFTIREYRSTWLDEPWLALIVTNNSPIDVGINGIATAYDEDGNAIKETHFGLSILGAGQTAPISFSVNGGKDASYFDYTLDYDTEPQYVNAIQDLSIESEADGQTVTVTATNNGSSSVAYVSAYAVYFDEQGQVMNTGQAFVRDDDRELKAGKTETVKMEARDPFATVEVYVLAYRWK